MQPLDILQNISIVLRLTGRFTLIFYFNREHFLFVYIIETEEKFGNFIIFLVDFQNLIKIYFDGSKVMKFRSLGIQGASRPSF